MYGVFLNNGSNNVILTNSFKNYNDALMYKLMLENAEEKIENAIFTHAGRNSYYIEIL